MEQKRNRISVINEDILCDKNLTPAEKMVYARICYFEVFFESAKATAEYLGVKEWTVQSAKRKLEKLGYIRCVKNNGRGKQYIADINLDIGNNKGRYCLEQYQILEKTKSDVGENNIRPWENQDIGKIEKENIEENIISKEISKKSQKKETRKVNKEGKVVGGNVQVERAYELWEEIMGFPLSGSGDDRRYASAIMRNKKKGESWLVDMLEKLSQAYEDRYSGIKPTIFNFKTLHYNSDKLLAWDSGENRKKAKKKELYKPKEGEDITYQRMFDKWKQYLGVGVKQTVEQVEACKELVGDVGEEGVERLIVALRMRSEQKFLTRELKSVKDFVSLNENKMIVQSFYDEHWRYWKLKQEKAAQGKKIWEG